MTNMKKILCLLALVMVVPYAHAQEWVDGMKDHRVNFYEVQKSFNEYWKDREVEKGKGWKQFKRWENFMEPRVYPTGERPEPSLLFSAMQAASAQMSASQNLGEWQPVGPFQGNPMGGIGRINCIAFDPQHPDTVYVGAPAGGFWTSYNGGQTWTTTTDQLTNIGVSSIAVDPSNPQVIYIGTGDRDGGDTYSYGIMKSTDGGKTWNPTGFNQSISSNTRIGQVWVDPSNSQVVIAATWWGIYRSANAGQTWQLEKSGTFHSVVSNPLNPDVLYAATIGANNAKIYKSTDNGLSWNQLTSGLPTSGVRRVEIGLTPADTSYIYLLYGASNNGFYGMYRSVNGGQSFSLRANSPNLMGWAVSGNDSGGQAWYDLCIAVDPQNKDIIYTGGVNIWRSTNGGTSWSLEAHWYGGGGAPYVHADHHYMAWQPKTDQLWIGNDGGITSKARNQSVYTDHNDGLNITQYYKIGISETNSSKIIAGAQDNGTHLNNLNWNRVRGGDGMDCEIDPANENVLYSSVYYGQFRKSTNNGNSWNANFNLPPSGQGNWVTPFVIDPNNNLVLYAGFSSLWKSTNGGASFSAVSGSVGGTTNIDHIAVAPSNSNYIYIAVDEDLFRSTNGGANFSLISTGITNNNPITDIAVNPFNENDVFITKSGYSSGNKVFRSQNGGQSWTNLSAGLPNLPANAIVFQSGTNGGVYVGTDIGVFYRDDLTSTWISYNMDLPRVIIADLEIRYSDKKLVAGTYGRGVWESPLITELKDSPVADFEATPSKTCGIGDTILIEDKTLKFPTQWKWNFYPSTPIFVNGTSDSSQNPQVVFNQPGSYSVVLSASNNYGTSQKVKTHYLEIGGAKLPFREDFEGNWMAYWSIDNPDNNITWAPVTANNGDTTNQAAWMDFYNYSSIGQADALISPPISLVGVSNPTMTFDHAYTQYGGGTVDSLVVFASSDCGLTYQRLAGYSGTNLSTVPNSSNPFSPSGASDWCFSCKTIGLSSYAGQTGIRIKFVAYNDYGNNLYLDNINITGTPLSSPVADLLGDTVICSSDSAQFHEISTGYVGSYQWYFPGGSPSTSTAKDPKVFYGTPGTYSVSLVAMNAAGQDSVYRSAFITVNSSVVPSLALTPSSTTICEGDQVLVTANPTNPGPFPTYEWYLNGSRFGGTSATQLFANLQPGDQITAYLRSSDPCRTLDSVQSAPLSLTVNPRPTVTLSNIPNQCVSTGSVTLSGGSPVGGFYKGNFVSNGQFDPQAAGVGFHTVWYVYSNSFGCSDSASVQIRVEQEPAIFLTPKDLCENDPIETLNWGFPFGGVYTVNGDTATQVDPSQLGPGKYTVSYYVPVGSCVGEMTDTMNIYSNPPVPQVTVTWGIMTCSVTGVKYQWLDANGNPLPGDTNQVFYPTTPGQYKVIVTNENGCTSESGLYTINRVGLDEWAKEHGLNLFPNPTHGRVTLNFGVERSTTLSLELHNVAGQIVWSSSLDTQPGKVEYSLDLGSNPPGMYFLHIEEDTGHSVIKLEIQ